MPPRKHRFIACPVCFRRYAQPSGSTSKDPCRQCSAVTFQGVVVKVMIPGELGGLSCTGTVIIYNLKSCARVTLDLMYIAAKINDALSNTGLHRTHGLSEKMAAYILTAARNSFPKEFAAATATATAAEGDGAPDADTDADTDAHHRAILQAYDIHCRKDYTRLSKTMHPDKLKTPGATEDLICEGAALWARLTSAVNTVFPITASGAN